jgi:hypothetical protein
MGSEAGGRRQCWSREGRQKLSIPMSAKLQIGQAACNKRGDVTRRTAKGVCVSKTLPWSVRLFILDNSAFPLPLHPAPKVKPSVSQFTLKLTLSGTVTESLKKTKQNREQVVWVWMCVRRGTGWELWPRGSPDLVPWGGMAFFLPFHQSCSLWSQFCTEIPNTLLSKTIVPLFKIITDRLLHLSTSTILKIFFF